MASYLLDTSVILWSLREPERFGPKTTKIISTQNCYISVASIWEIIIKVQAGKLWVPQPISEVIDLLRATELPITIKHVRQLTDIELPHKDPFDAMLVAQAKAERYTLLTSDKILLNSNYDVMSAKA